MLFRHMIGVAAMLAALASSAIAQSPDLPTGDRGAIVAVIERQLAAFQADRAVEAFDYASPGIQRIFRTPEIFMDMVRTGFMPVYRPREVRFLDLVIEGGRLTQRVLLVGPDGVPVIAHYFVERQPDGGWRINGVTLHRSGEQTT